MALDAKRYGEEARRARIVNKALMEQGEMLVTTEALTREAIDNHKWRVAWYGGSCDIGETYFIGTWAEVCIYLKESGQCDVKELTAGII